MVKQNTLDKCVYAIYLKSWPHKSAFRVNINASKISIYIFNFTCAHGNHITKLKKLVKACKRGSMARKILESSPPTLFNLSGGGGGGLKKVRSFSVGQHMIVLLKLKKREGQSDSTPEEKFIFYQKTRSMFHYRGPLCWALIYILTLSTEDSIRILN